MYKDNLLPIGETDDHYPTMDCPCGPKVIVYMGREFLSHRSFDNREIWLAVELMLGMTCYEHMRFVNDEYEPGDPHRHRPNLPPYYEYEHERIDPR